MPSTSYAVMDGSYKYMFDRYNSVYRWIPMNADVAGICARADDINAYISPAGFTRGNIKGAELIAYIPNHAERDDLYVNGINPIASFPGKGKVLFGDKTLLARPSSFDRINVRRLFIILEKAIANAAENLLFEFNDEFTRLNFISIIEPFLRDVQGSRGIESFMVVCDGTNNTPAVINRNEFRGDIFIKPTKSINFIGLNFVAVASGVEFSEVVNAI
jgi:phage tail sheath protein FI